MNLTKLIASSSWLVKLTILVLLLFSVGIGLTDFITEPMLVQLMFTTLAGLFFYAFVASRLLSFTHHPMAKLLPNYYSLLKTSLRQTASSMKCRKHPGQCKTHGFVTTVLFLLKQIL